MEHYVATSILFSFLLHILLVYFFFNWSPFSGENTQLELIPLVTLSDLQIRESTKKGLLFQDKQHPFPETATETLLLEKQAIHRSELQGFSKEPTSTPSLKQEIIQDSKTETKEVMLPKQMVPKENTSDIEQKKEIMLSKQMVPKENTLDIEQKEASLQKTPSSSSRTPSLSQMLQRPSASPKTPKSPTGLYEVEENIPQLLLSDRRLAKIIIQARALPKRAPKTKIAPIAPNSELFNILSTLNLVAVGEVQQNILPVERLSEQESSDYFEQLNHFIVALWEVPFHLIESNLTIVIHFRIEKTGKILHYQIQETSGNPILDLSVQKLLKKLKFLPPLPATYPKPIYEFGLRFSPEYFQF